MSSTEIERITEQGDSSKSQLKDSSFKKESQEESVTSTKPSDASSSIDSTEDVVRPSMDIRLPSIDKDDDKIFQKHETLSETKKTSVLQKQLHKKLLNRLDVGANTCKTMKMYFIMRANVAQQYAQLLTQLPRIHPLGEMGSLESGLDYLQNISAQERELAVQFGKKVIELVDKPLTDLYTELIEKRASITQQAQQHHTVIDTLFDKVSKAYTTFRGSVSDARKLVGEKKEVAVDPYLKQVQYFDALNQLHIAQKSYNRFLEDFYEDMEKLDIKRIESLKNISREFFIPTKQHDSEVE